LNLVKEFKPDIVNAQFAEWYVHIFVLQPVGYNETTPASAVARA